MDDVILARMPGVATFTPSTAKAMSSKVIHVRTTMATSDYLFIYNNNNINREYNYTDTSG